MRSFVRTLLATLVVASGVVLVAGPSSTAATAAGCTVTAKLVNPCRPWLGAYVSDYANSGDWGGQIAAHERRIGRKLDIVHSYHPVGGNGISRKELTYVNRANTILMMNWKSSTKWADAKGGNAKVNAGIDKLAKSVKALGSKKIIINMAHEPENDVSGGGTGCTNPRFHYKGHLGTPADYRAMWKNVHKRFAALGVKNVVWAVNFQGYALRYCLIDDLWPGNALVDWVFFDSYGEGTNANFVQLMARFYDFMSKNSNASHDYLSKAWGVAEWNTKSSTAASEADFYKQAKAAVESNRFPRMKAWVIYDTTTGGGDFRTAYFNKALSAVKQGAYKAFAQSSAFK